MSSMSLVLLLPFAFVLALFVLVMIFVLTLVRTNRNTARMSDQETKLLQDVADSMEKLERRIENLETILHRGVHTERRE